MPVKLYPMPPNVLILTALRFEANQIARVLGLRFLTPTMAAGEHIALQVVGPKATHLPASLPQDCASVFLVGLGGGLLPALRRGDIVVEDVEDAASIGKIVSAPHVVSTPADKAMLHRQTGASVVDMESDTVRAWAKQHGLHLTIMRAISDTASETLDPAMLRLVNVDGMTRPLSIVQALIKKPSLLSAILRLRHSGRIVRGLAMALKERLSV